jgi:hypothetical protein
MALKEDSSAGALARPLGTPPILFLGGGLVVSRIGNVCTAVWRSGSTVQWAGKPAAALAQVIRQAPGRAAFLCVVEEGSTAPDEEARKASARMLEAENDKLRAVAVVIEGTGFAASIVRSAVSNIVWLARQRSKVPVCYFETVEAGARWLTEHVHIGPLDAFIHDVELTRGVVHEPNQGP